MKSGHFHLLRTPEVIECNFGAGDAIARVQVSDQYTVLTGACAQSRASATVPHTASALRETSVAQDDRDTQMASCRLRTTWRDVPL